MVSSGPEVLRFVKMQHCKESVFLIVAVYKECETTDLWDTLVCVVIGSSESCGWERSYNMQRAPVKQNEVSTEATLFMWYFSNPGKFCCYSLLCSRSLVKHSADTRHYPHPATCSWDFLGLHRSIFVLNENLSLHEIHQEIDKQTDIITEP